MNSLPNLNHPLFIPIRTFQHLLVYKSHSTPHTTKVLYKQVFPEVLLSGLEIIYNSIHLECMKVRICLKQENNSMATLKEEGKEAIHHALLIMDEAVILLWIPLNLTHRTIHIHHRGP